MAFEQLMAESMKKQDKEKEKKKDKQKESTHHHHHPHMPGHSDKKSAEV